MKAGKHVARALAAIGGMAMLAWSTAGLAADATYNDADPDNRWSVAVANWGAGFGWLDGDNAIFGGTGETVDVDGAVSVGNITFNAGGYVVGDPDASGVLTLVGAPSVVTVANAGDTNVLSEGVQGTAGLLKTGPGTLVLSGTNSITGQILVDAGTLKLTPTNILALAATGAGNETIVTNGATLDFAGAYAAAGAAEDLILSGHGVGGQGALINTGVGQLNRGFRHVTLMGDTTIGGPSRIDMDGSGTFTGNGWTLTKAGAMEMAITRAITGTPIVINGGLYTIQHALAIGGADFDTTINDGRLNCWGNYSIAERLVMNGGGLSEGSISNTFNLTGHLTFNSNVSVVCTAERRVMLSGIVDGAGGLTNSGGGRLLLVVDTIGFAGETVNLGATYLHIGTNGLAAGLPGPGPLVNHGHLCIDRSGTLALSNTVAGTGITYVRYGGELLLQGIVATQTSVRIGHGSLTLAAGASMTATGDVTVADRQGVLYTAEPTQVVGVINIPAGCQFTANCIIGGNGTNVLNGAQLGTINQYGGSVRTTGATAENNGLRLGHYPQAYCIYNMMGGTLTIGAGYDLGIATDGTGWVHQTGGEIQARTVMLNERTNGFGYGRLTVEGGVLTVGDGGITRDPTAPYRVEYGGSGAVVRASASFVSPLDATLAGTDAAAVSFDPAGFDIALTGVLGGDGGLNKTGAGRLILSAANAYAGSTVVQGGTLLAANTNGSATGAGPVNVIAGGTLRGTGAIDGAVSVAAGGTLAPGASVGTLRVGGETVFSDDGVFFAEIAGDSADLLSTTSNITLGGATLNVAPSAPTAGGYVLMVATNAAIAGHFQDAVGNPLGEGAVVPGMPGFFVHYLTSGHNDYVLLTRSPGSSPVPRFSVIAEDGQAVVRIRTAFELEAATFNVYRKDGADWLPVNIVPIPANGTAASGFEGTYLLTDVGVVEGSSYEYKLVMDDVNGGQVEYGPYVRTVSAFEMTSPVRATPASVEVRWLSRAGESYRVLRSTNLLDTARQTVGEGIAPTPPQNVFVDTNAPAGVRMYRVELEP